MSLRQNRRTKLREFTFYCIRKTLYTVLLSEVTANESGVIWIGEGENTAVVIHSKKAAIMLCRSRKHKLIPEGQKKWTGDRVAAVTVNGLRLVAWYKPLWDHGDQASEMYRGKLQEQLHNNKEGEHNKSSSSGETTIHICSKVTATSSIRALKVPLD